MEFGPTQTKYNVDVFITSFLLQAQSGCLINMAGKMRGDREQPRWPAEGDIGQTTAERVIQWGLVSF